MRPQAKDAKTRKATTTPASRDSTSSDLPPPRVVCLVPPPPPDHNPAGNLGDSLSETCSNARLGLPASRDYARHRWLTLSPYPPGAIYGATPPSANPHPHRRTIHGARAGIASSILTVPRRGQGRVACVHRRPGVSSCDLLHSGPLVLAWPCWA